ncbi:MAG: hypothetical protein JST48_10650 [Bacteroidetes bacterium]|nr:hypothetical protein [Bacteroidota bacterium]
MYNAKSIENSELELFSLMLDQYLKYGKEDYKKISESIIITAHKLAKNEIDLYKIDQSIYNLVYLIAKDNKPYFADQVDPENISDNVFKTVRDFLATLITKRGTFHVV